MSFSAGLYIGIDFVDLVILDELKKRPRIVKSSRVPIYEEGALSDAGNRLAAVNLAMRKALDMAAVKVKAVNFCVPQDEVIVRRFGMPYLGPEERPSAVRFEAQRYLPFKLDETVSDFYIAYESKAEKKMEVVFVAVSKKEIEKYIGIFHDLRLSVDISDIAPIALLRLLYACNRIKEDETKALIYVEKNSRGSVIIIKDNNVYLTREIGAPASKETFFEDILNNLRLSIDYFKRETKEAEVNHIVICAEPSLPELELFLEQNMVSSHVETFGLKNEFDGLNELSAKQVIAIGLAMGSFDRIHPRLNLLTRPAKEGVAKEVKEYRPLVIEGIALFLILAMLQISANIGLGVAKKKMGSQKMLNMGIAAGVSLDAPKEQLLDMEKKANQKLAFLNTLVGRDRIFLTKKLNSLGRVLPEGAWVESFQFSDDINKGKTLNIDGIIYSKEGDETTLAQKTLSDMKGMQDFYSGFDDIKLGSLKRVTAYGKEVLAFTVRCSGIKQE